MQTTTTGAAGPLEPAVLDTLRVALGTALITPDDGRYGSACKVWNGMIDRHPAVVIQCRGVADVLGAVRLAGGTGLPLAVRGGGHNVAGFATCDGGIVIDLCDMRGVRVDAEARTVRCGAGARWGDVDRETQTFGLAVPGGVVSTTGVAGLTLGGGQGWLRRTYGMTCDSLISADVVTADGRYLVASESENEDLFWGLRGGGGNFGVVTSFQFRAYPVGPNVAFAGPVYPLERAVSVTAGLRDFMTDAPDEVNVGPVFWTIPAVPAFPEAFHGRAVVIVGAVYAGPPEEGERVLQPLRALDEPLFDMSAILPFTAVQQLFDPFFPPGQLRYYWKSLFMERLDDEAMSELVAHVDRRPSSLSMIGIWPLGGAMDRRDRGATAAGGEAAPYLAEILANWSDLADTEANVEWARSAFDALQKFGSGRTNLNFPGFGDEAEFVRAAFGDNYERLVALKRKYDPTNLFRLNQNIAP